MMRAVTAGRRRSAALWTAAALAAFVTAFAPQASAQQAPKAASFDVLQLNLCNGGFANCYSAGRSVDSAIEAIQQRRPDVVTLNEICAPDITRITHETGYQGEFTPIGSKVTGAPQPCSEGRGDYGVAVLAHPDHGAIGEGKIERQFTAQDGGKEARVMLCAPFSNFAACTGYLSTNGKVASEQCGELAQAATGFGASTVVGGDLNLAEGGNPDVRACVPDGWYSKGDGTMQHVLATNAFTFERSENLPVEGTDHPGFLVETVR
ncbi:endonuclease/exonuclease/phosphatase family protein [Saccharopolyspora taberi]|uniref:Endonuclease/exonuclease/phosphatase domain-containing protein n=1 Tax=Saccharopolyspora taberi TaxID=60895 RepID=A0ABN3VL86_9PSEU